MACDVCREYHIAQLSRKNVQRLFLTRQELLSIVPVERLLRAHALEQRRKPLSVLEGGIVRLKRSGAMGLHRIAGVKECGSHMEILTEDNDTPVPMALASNTNPLVSDELYQQFGQHELAHLVKARPPGRQDPSLKQVAKQVWRVTVGKGWGADFEGGCRVKGAEGLCNDLCNPVNIAQTLLTLDRAVVFHADPPAQPSATPAAAGPALAAEAVLPPGFVQPQLQAPAMQPAPAVAGTSQAQQPGLQQQLHQGLPLPAWIQAALQRGQQQPHQQGSIPASVSAPPNTLAVPARPGFTNVAYQHEAAGPFPGLGLGASEAASQQPFQPAAAATAPVVFQASATVALEDPRLVPRQQAAAALAGVPLPTPTQAQQPAAAAAGACSIPQPLLRHLSAAVALQQVQRGSQSAELRGQQPSPAVFAGWEHGGHGDYPASGAAHKAQHMAASPAPPVAHASLLGPSTATVAAHAAREGPPMREPARTSTASTAGPRRMPSEQAEQRGRQSGSGLVYSWAVDLFRRAVLWKLARTSGSDSEERSISMSMLAGVMKSLSMGSSREWTAAQEGMSFKEFCLEMVDRCVLGSGVRMRYTELPDRDNLEWVLVLPPGVEARLREQCQAAGSEDQQRQHEPLPVQPPQQQQQQEDQRRRGERGGKRQRRDREQESDRGGGREKGACGEAGDRRNRTTEGRQAKAQRSSRERPY